MLYEFKKTHQVYRLYQTEVIHLITIHILVFRDILSMSKIIKCFKSMHDLEIESKLQLQILIVMRWKMLLTDTHSLQANGLLSTHLMQYSCISQRVNGV